MSLRRSGVLFTRITSHYSILEGLNTGRAIIGDLTHCRPMKGTFSFINNKLLKIKNNLHECQSRLFYQSVGVLTSSNGSNQDSEDESEKQSVGQVQAKMCIVYTCKVCQTRSAKLFTKQAYEKGIVIVRCPGCESLHLIADNLGWFKHVEHRNIEDILKGKGEKVKTITDVEGTTEITLEDLLGNEKLQDLIDKSNKD